ncbi:hypothetical protein KIW84_044536 [Lathyrus oleraceus]|uniref:Uncharacterized protein n=1 Tax=Pisum sativum TaxID=3888 RepID=A0A9D5AT33_PEA|nr:hypothetical protein KIW84_044536 [Pisum sativum]
MPSQSRTLFRLQRRPLESIFYCLFAILNNKVLEISLPSKLQTHKDTPEFCSKTIAITNSLMKATKSSFLTVTKNTPTLSKQSASGSPVRIKTNPEENGLEAKIRFSFEVPIRYCFLDPVEDLEYSGGEQVVHLHMDSGLRDRDGEEEGDEEEEEGGQIAAEQFDDNWASVVDDEAGERLLGRNRNDDEGLDNNKTKKKGKKAGYFSDESDHDDDD